MNKYVLAMFVSVIAVASLLGTSIVQAAPYVNITAKIAYEVITSGVCPNLVILDVRTREEFEEGHIRKALLIPHSELEERIDELAMYRDREIIVHCYCGMRSMIACGILDAHGFSRVYNMMEGINGWMGHGYPVTTSYLTQIFVSISPNSAKTSQDITLKGILTDQFSQPVASETVELYYRDYYCCGKWRFALVMHTNDFGVFSASGRIPKAGIYEVGVCYRGSEYLEPSYQLAILVVTS